MVECMLITPKWILKFLSARFLLSGVILCVAFQVTSHTVAGPLSRFNPLMRHIEADPTKSYSLDEDNGPWMILATTFAGPEAEQEARDLVLEFRRDFDLASYIHKKRFDYSEPVVGLGLNKFGGPKKMRYQQRVAFDEWAVLVGDFDTLDDNRIKKTLHQVKYLRPRSLGNTKTQRFRGIRDLYHKVSADKAKQQKGPMGHAFVTRNPLLPQEFFTPAGIDRFVYQLNKNVDFNLLDCPGKHTVRVATFRGNVVIDQRKINKIVDGAKMESRLADAGEKANKLVRALRGKGIEAYVFHDRNESIVTVGSFAQVGSPTPDGKIRPHAAILRVMEEYGPESTSVSGVSSGIQPRVMAGLPFDVQPYPIEVPRYSVSRDAVSTGWFR